jgi:REP-associated tyrosine transposase
MKHYERRLPHFEVIGQPLFVTFRLHGSLPRNRMFPPAQMTDGKSFFVMDRILDEAATGPKYLAIPEIATLVVSALWDLERRFDRCEVHSFVVMPNHVHALVTPCVEATKWLAPLKAFTSRQANLLLARTGRFWQEESYDRLVRYGAEFDRIQRYIENNPVSARLAAEPERFPWSSVISPSQSSLSFSPV